MCPIPVARQLTKSAIGGKVSAERAGIGQLRRSLPRVTIRSLSCDRSFVDGKVNRAAAKRSAEPPPRSAGGPGAGLRPPVQAERGRGCVAGGVRAGCAPARNRSSYPRPRARTQRAAAAAARSPGSVRGRAPGGMRVGGTLEGHGRRARVPPASAAGVLDYAPAGGPVEGAWGSAPR